MPRIFGMNIIAVIVAAIALFMTGFVFYGLLFTELWTGLWDFTPEKLAEMEAAGSGGMAFGFLISLATAFFLSVALKKMGKTELLDAIKGAIFLWLGFAVPTMAYDTVYAAQPLMLLVLDSAHLLVGFVIAATVLTFMDGVAVKD